MDDRQFRSAMGKFATGVTVISNRGRRRRSRNDCECVHVRFA